MYKVIIIFILLGGLLSTPTHISIDYYTNNFESFEDISSDAYVWVYTPTDFSYYIYGASYIEEANGETVFIFESNDTNFAKLDVNSAFLTYNNETIKLDNLINSFSFNEGASKKNSVNVTFLIPEEVYSIAESFQIEIKGKILGKDESVHDFLYRKDIIKNNKSFSIPFISHLYNQLTLT